MSDNITLIKIAQEQATQAGQISTIMNHMSDIKKNQEGFQDSVQRILSFLENDNATGSKGIVARQGIIESRISAIELERGTEKTKQKIYIGVATFVGGLIMSIASFGFKLIFGK